MQIAKKQLLGFGGLALVVAMTAFATTLPTGAVSSSTAGGSVDVYVQVYGVNTETIINSPLDGEVYSSPLIEFKETHSHAYGVKYYIQKVNSDGTFGERIKLDYEVTGDDVNGVTTLTLDLNQYGGTGVYVLTSEATTEYGTLASPSHVQFTYAAIDAKQEDVVTSATATKFSVSYTSGIKSLTYQVLDSNGNPVTDKFIANTLAPATGGVADFTIDLTNLNLKSGEYTIYIEGYDEADAKGDLIDTAKVTFKYTVPDAPNVPDTGSLLSALNISRADYLITGLIGFVAISIIALFVIRKAKKQQ